MKRYFIFLILQITCTVAFTQSITIKAEKSYLNIPVSHIEERDVMTMEIESSGIEMFDIRLADDDNDYWVFRDISSLKGKKITLSFPSERKGMKMIYQSDQIAGEDSLYREQNRPQYHFSSRRGWNNDPNGLVYHEGEYHLFYQHNPYERDWGNMHWGHAVSSDLIHWKELPVALYPDDLGTIFSGSVVIDHHNTAGFNSGKDVAMVALYTADSPDKQVQCLAYSLDKGRSWTKYAHNPVIDSGEKWQSKDTRDPKVFWYEPDNKWVMVLNERDGHSIYNSTDLKHWIYQSHITGFWECPELFELPVEGNIDRTRWVMYGASGTYMIGDFNGEKFSPESGKHYYTTGSGYAGQTFNNIPPSDGRRIQISWGRIPSGEMPFNMMMLLPVQLTLREVKNGLRLYSSPLEEVNMLARDSREWHDLTVEEANQALHSYENDELLRLRFTLTLSHATGAGLNLNEQSLLNYDLNFNTVNGVFYSPENMTSMEVTADIFLDKTSVELFIDDGAYSCSFERKKDHRKEGFRFWGNNIRIKSLRVNRIESIWN